MNVGIGLKLGFKPASSLLGKVPRVKVGKKETLIVLGASGITAALMYPLFLQMVEQEASEMEELSAQASSSVVGFSKVEDIRHGQIWPTETRDSLKISLLGGKSCTAYFTHSHQNSLGTPMGGDITDWGNCPTVAG